MIPTERNTRIIEAVRKGASIKEVMDQEHLSYYYIKAMCTRAGINIPRRRTVKSFVILKALLDGIGPSEISRRHDVSRQWIFTIKQEAIKAGFNFKETFNEDVDWTGT